MIQMEYPKLPLEGLSPAEQVRALKRQVDILTDNLQIVLNSIEADTSNVDNTSDKDKPISDATRKALDDIEEQIANINDILDGKVSKSGDTMTGTLRMQDGVPLRFRTRKSSTAGGWAYTHIGWEDASGSLFAYLGIYGNADSLYYWYLGTDMSSNSWASTDNLWIYPKGSSSYPNGGIIAPNGYRAYIRNSDGDARNVLALDSYNYTYYGNGSYASNEGRVYYEGNEISILSKGGVSITAPNGITNSGAYNALYKIVDVTVSVPAGSSGSNVNSANYAITVPTGYTAVGVVGISVGSFAILPCNWCINGTNVRSGFHRLSATTSAYNVVFKVLCLKATSA